LKFQSDIGNIRAGFNQIFFGIMDIPEKESIQKIGGYDDIPFLEMLRFAGRRKDLAGFCRSIEE